MKLSALVEQANKTYRLRLDKDQCVAVIQRLKMAGYEADLKDAPVGSVLDEILATADDVTKNPGISSLQGHVIRSYGALKREVVAAVPDDRCPRCGDPLNQVKLVGDRPAKYCKACHITLPNRAEE